MAASTSSSRFSTGMALARWQAATFQHPTRAGLQVSLQVLDAGVEVRVELPLPVSRVIGVVLECLGATLQLAGLPLERIDLLRKLHETLVLDNALHRLQTPLELVQLDQDRIIRPGCWHKLAAPKPEGYGQSGNDETY